MYLNISAVLDVNHEWGLIVRSDRWFDCVCCISICPWNSHQRRPNNILWTSTDGVFHVYSSSISFSLISSFSSSAQDWKLDCDVERDKTFFFIRRIHRPKGDYI